MSRKLCDPKSRGKYDIEWLRLQIQERNYEQQERVFMAKEDVRYHEREKEKYERLQEEIEWEKCMEEALAICGKELDEKLALMKKPKSKKRRRHT